jgi:hypothetical protein
MTQQETDDLYGAVDEEGYQGPYQHVLLHQWRVHNHGNRHAHLRACAAAASELTHVTSTTPDSVDVDLVFQEITFALWLRKARFP